MSLNPASANCYIMAANKFSEQRARALRHSILAKLSGQSTKLDVFPESVRRDHPNRKLSSVIDIRLDQIIGTVSRDTDFDRDFRPLGKHLLDRWVNVFVNFNPDSWSPILVHKVGEQYYVEDGHHRVSVARSLGMLYIQAKVWEYPLPQKKSVSCEQVKCCEEKRTKKAYVRLSLR
ncbi:MAG: hypothetical protein HY865_02520 [Chloroflexi bacterium]|nr:hypothetical protein [Chloroflexota bacterium]